MSSYLLDRITRDERISVHVETVVSELRGVRQLEYVVLRSRGSAQPTTVPTHCLLAMIGAEPHTEWLPPEVACARKAASSPGTLFRLRSGTAPSGRRSAARRTCTRRACRARSPPATSGPAR
jgi:hypothetical protein